MKYISAIKRDGLLCFLLAVGNELRKKEFTRREKVRNKSKDTKTYSQYSEDLYIDRILGHKFDGFYVDVGANNPTILSNTKKFYDNGWAGINIEPDYNNFNLFVKERPRDKNLNLGISDTPGKLIFYVFEEDTLSTFSQEDAEKLVTGGRNIVEKKIIETFKLSKIFEDNDVKKIDFMTIDTERYDQKVLNSNDWSRFRPTLICIEDNGENNFEAFFSAINYKKTCHNGLNSFFIDNTDTGNKIENN